ncbi:MAG: SGNH/GDSL hydrolase family protein [Planctomycetes bacterium]|nr:SGNH/GDSL hydrolase family protein [Planctomycetota bacterium]
MHRTAKLVLVPLSIGLVGLAIGEILARTVFARATPARAMAAYDPDEHADFRLRPIDDRSGGASLRVTEHGTRGKDFDPRKPDGVFRILGLGDSFAFGRAVGDDETFYARSARLLTERHGHRGIEVLNAGCPSYGIWQEAAVLEHRALAWQLDAVVVQTFLWNDAFESTSRDSFTVVDGFLIPTELVDEVPAWKRRLVAALDHSALFRLVRVVGADPDAAARGGRLRTGGLGERARSLLYVDELRWHEPIGPAWKLCLEQLRGLVDLAQAHALPVAVLNVPGLREVSKTSRSTWAQRLSIPVERLDVGAPWRDVERMLAKDGVLLVDLRPTIDALDDDAIDALYVADGHLSQAGHALAADVLARALHADGRFTPKR